MAPSIYQKLLKCRQKNLFIVTDSTVGPLYGEELSLFLQENGFKATLIQFPAGEVFKTRATKEYIEDEMLKAGAGRDSCIVALGGGVVLDVAGFVAATYARGIPLILIPTTLLAMCDASIGGKTAVNTPYGKNLIGSYHMPELVLRDVSFLETLSEEELKNGYVEMIKHAAILDKNYFELLEKRSCSLEEAIEISVMLKSKVVALDPQESGLRRILNFGHTVGHAIESMSNYTVSHGRAVAIGMLLESQMADSLGFYSAYDRLKTIFESYEIDLSLDFPLDTLYEHMCLDKKSDTFVPRIVILEEIGTTQKFDNVYCYPCTRLNCQKLQMVKTKALPL
ncbi:MAG: 3-dehydroquinate synthase [Verrucomicrobia bacterium]|nr:3-dehydroquinate synthase [Verrucomicrobiota bacterium]MBS0636270.1 3-dehydroquinate synthase [Verrucomicrobiota bacterium]